MNGTPVPETAVTFALKGHPDGKEHDIIIDRANQVALASGAVLTVAGFKVKGISCRLTLTDHDAAFIDQKPVLEIEPE